MDQADVKLGGWVRLNSGIIGRAILWSPCVFLWPYDEDGRMVRLKEEDIGMGPSAATQLFERSERGPVH